MKKLFLVFLILHIGLFAQLNNTNFNVMRGDATTLTFASKYNLSSDTLIFVVKASKDITAVRLIQKTTYDNQITVSTGTKSFLYIKLLSDDTDDLTLAKYFYDITRIKNGDTTTIFIGEINLQPDIGTPYDGTDITGRVTTVSLANGTIQDEIIVWDTTQNKWIPSGNLFDYVTDTLRQEVKKIYGIIEDGSVTTWNVFGFNSDATNVISGDTLIVTDASGELDLEGIVSSNNYDFTIVGTPTAYQLKVEWGGFTGKIISFIWQTDTLSQAFPLYSGTSNTYNYDIDTTSLSNRINLKFNTADTSIFVSDALADAKYPTKTSMQTVDDSLASDIAENKLTTHFFAGTDSIHYGADSIVVSHGVGSTPTFVAIQLISDGFGFQTWVSGINSLTFYVRRSDTGLKTITSYIKFKWMAYK